MGARELAAACGLPSKLMYTVAETAKYTGLPRSTISAEYNAGRLKATKARGRRNGTYITPEAVDAWAEANS